MNWDPERLALAMHHAGVGCYELAHWETTGEAPLFFTRYC